MEDTQRAYEEWLKAQKEPTAPKKKYCSEKCPYYSKEYISNIKFPNCPTLLMTHCKLGATGMSDSHFWNKYYCDDCPHPEWQRE